MTQSYWLAEFARLERCYRSFWPQDTTPRNGKLLLWGDAMKALPAYLTMYEWSGCTVYLDLFTERADQIAAWYPWKNFDTDQETPSIDFGIGAALLRFCNVACCLPQYTAAVTRYRLLCLPLATKWEHLWVDSPGAYRSLPDGAGYAPSQPLNLQALAGLYHYEAGSLDRAQVIARTIESFMELNPVRAGALNWRYTRNMLPGDQWTERLEDIGHAEIIMLFMVRQRPWMRLPFIETVKATVGGNGVLYRRLNATIEADAAQIQYVRLLELGPELYPIVAEMWQARATGGEVRRSGEFMPIPALCLLRQFPL